jgi:protein SCO1/2
MTRFSKLAVAALVGGVLAWGSTAQAQGVTVDANLASQGKKLFTNRGCTTCHSIGKGTLAGPDLLGVVERRDLTWLKNWLKDPAGMLASDTLAQRLLAEAKGVKMPNVKLQDREIDALIHYMAQESVKQRGS